MSETKKPAPEDLERRKNQPTTLLLKVVGAGLTMLSVTFMGWAGVLWSQNTKIIEGQQELLQWKSSVEVELTMLKAQNIELKRELIKLSEHQRRIEVEFSRRIQ